MTFYLIFGGVREGSWGVAYSSKYHPCVGLIFSSQILRVWHYFQQVDL